VTKDTKTTPKTKVAITIFDMGYDFQREIKIMNEMGLYAVFVPLEGTQNEVEIIEKLTGFDYVMAGTECWSAAVFSALRGKLKMVARLGVGMDNVDMEAATSAGIALSNTPGGNACSVAQHAIALMLALARNIVCYDASIRSGHDLPRAIAADLLNATIGLVGFGNIAQTTAELLRGFNCEIIAYDIVMNEDAAKRVGVNFVSLDEIAIRSDFISIHVPLVKQTRGIINEQFFSKMKPNAYLINTSRGGIVNELDLVNALHNQTIAGAGLDVSENSMYKADNPFRGLKNTILTPYVAFSSMIGNRKTFDIAIKSIHDHYMNIPIHRLLNPGYMEHL